MAKSPPKTRQLSSYDVARPYLEAGNPLGAVLALEKALRTVRGSDQRWDYLQALGWHRSTIGRYQEAIACFDSNAPLDAPGADFGRARPVDAVDEILNVARVRRALFINEAHHVPQHRTLTMLLLKGLYGLGFRFLACETLNEWDHGLNDRGYPLQRLSGFYSEEPLYGDMVRAALRLGYALIPYEDNAPNSPDGGPAAEMNKRDRVQAENIKSRILDKDPRAKILVHAGFHHIRKATSSGWVHMAQEFQRITGIEPFSIDQTEVMEHSSPRWESDAYRAASGLRQTAPFIMKREDGGYWTEPSLAGYYDLHVIHPRTRYVHGRPDWITMRGARTFVPIPRKLLGRTFPCLVQAFCADEPAFAVPVDQVSVKRRSGAPFLALPKGNFRLRAMGADGRIASEPAVKV